MSRADSVVSITDSTNECTFIMQENNHNNKIKKMSSCAIMRCLFFHVCLHITQSVSRCVDVSVIQLVFYSQLLKGLF